MEEGRGPATADCGTAGDEGPATGAAPGAAAEAAHHPGSCRPGPVGEEERPDSGWSPGSEGQADRDWDLEEEEGSPYQGSGGYNSPEPPALPAHDSATGFPVGGTDGVSDEEGAEEWGAAVPGPLHHAAAAGQLRRARALLAAGEEVDGQALPEYYTPLHLAASEGHKRVVEALLAAGAHPEALALGNRTPLMLAAGHGQAACFQPLLAAGTDVQAVDENNLTCLHHWAAWAALNPESDRALHALRALLDAGCDAAWHAPGSRTALDMLLRRHLGYTRAPGLPLTHVPEMVRCGRVCRGTSAFWSRSAAACAGKLVPIVGRKRPQRPALQAAGGCRVPCGCRSSSGFWCGLCHGHLALGPFPQRCRMVWLARGADRRNTGCQRRAAALRCTRPLAERRTSHGGRHIHWRPAPGEAGP